MTCLLLTNDYPPKIGGIQVYLWELWRRLPPDKVAVFTRDYPSSAAFDAKEKYPIIRSPRKALLPTNSLKRELQQADLPPSFGSGLPDLVLIDPAVPLGSIGRKLDVPYGVVLHGAEATIPTQLPALRGEMNRVLKGADLIVSASQWVLDVIADKNRPSSHGAAEPPGTSPSNKQIYIPPGVDTQRFFPHTPAQKLTAREKFGIPSDALVLLSVSRLVPRKGMDHLISATAALASEFPDLELVIAGVGRDLARLQSLAKRKQAPVKFAGRVPDKDLPALYGAADIFAMLCRQRWGGLEQEGFGVVFLEAAASGLPQVAGESGGAAEAVSHGESGFVVPSHKLTIETTTALRRLLSDSDLREKMGMAARQRTEQKFSYDILAQQLQKVLSFG